MRIAILGGTKGMGRALARKLAERGEELVLLGRDRDDLERSARDLEVRGDRPEGSVGTAVCDLSDPSTFVPALDATEELLADAAAPPSGTSAAVPNQKESTGSEADGGAVAPLAPRGTALRKQRGPGKGRGNLGGRPDRALDCVVVTAAAFGLQEELEEDPAATGRLLDTNFTGTVLFCEEARRRLLGPDGERPEADGPGVLCVFSSVAGERARKPVVLYGATKAGLTYYLEGLDRRYWDKGLRVVTVKPGFVRTSMTAGLDAPPFAGEPEGVAEDVVKAIDRALDRTGRGRAPVVYTPWPWRWVMLVIRNLPRAVMRRVGF